MQVDLPDVLAEVTEQFTRYEKALVTNDIAVLDGRVRLCPYYFVIGGEARLSGALATATRAGRRTRSLSR